MSLRIPTGFQKAPTRGPASLVAVRALAGRRPACDTAIVGHRNFVIEHDLACVPGPCRGAIHQDSAAQQHPISSDEHDLCPVVRDDSALDCSLAGAFARLVALAGRRDLREIPVVQG